jgi:hypothetical protein
MILTEEVQSNQYILDKLLANNSCLNKDKVQRVLIIYDEGLFFVGDSFIMFDRFGLCKKFFGGASIEINCLNNKYIDHYRSFAANNPNFDNVFSLDYPDIPFENYDVIICVATGEEMIIDVLSKKYDPETTDQLQCAIFSFSKLLLVPRIDFKIIFPMYEELFHFYEQYVNEPYEMYISAHERNWADNWLETNKIKKRERLFILLDSTSSKEYKLLRKEVYFGLLSYLLKIKHSRILIFDENGEKEDFYREQLSKKQMDKIIFSRRQHFRKDLCILSSNYVKLIFGPCTGLMHCASGIYNHFIKNGAPAASAPAMITYTGKWDSQFWWGSSPLVDCLVLREIANKKKLCILGSMNEDEKYYLDDRLECNEYTTKMLIDFIGRRLTTGRLN